MGNVSHAVASLPFLTHSCTASPSARPAPKSKGAIAATFPGAAAHPHVVGPMAGSRISHTCPAAAAAAAAAARSGTEITEPNQTHKAGRAREVG